MSKNTYPYLTQLNLEELLDLFNKYHLICCRTRSQSEAICKEKKYVMAKRKKTYLQCCIDLLQHKTVLKESLDDYQFWMSVEFEDNPGNLEI